MIRTGNLVITVKRLCDSQVILTVAFHVEGLVLAIPVNGGLDAEVRLGHGEVLTLKDVMLPMTESAV